MGEFVTGVREFMRIVVLSLMHIGVVLSILRRLEQLEATSYQTHMMGSPEQLVYK
jgi:hypothetical protein